MKKIILVAFAITLFSFGSKAQFDTSFAKSRIGVCLDSLADGFRQRNWEKFMRYSNPAMVGAIGGKEEFLRYVKESFEGIPDSAWKKYEPGNVLQVLKTEADLQAMVELNSVLEWQGMRFTTTHHLIAQSWDGGYYWSFFDSQNNRESSLLIKTDLSPQLIIPEKKQKVEPVK